MALILVAATFKLGPCSILPFPLGCFGVVPTCSPFPASFAQHIVHATKRSYTHAHASLVYLIHVYVVQIHLLLLLVTSLGQRKDACATPSHEILSKTCVKVKPIACEIHVLKVLPQLAELPAELGNNYIGHLCDTFYLLRV